MALKYIFQPAYNHPLSPPPAPLLRRVPDVSLIYVRQIKPTYYAPGGSVVCAVLVTPLLPLCASHATVLPRIFQRYLRQSRKSHSTHARTRARKTHTTAANAGHGPKQSQTTSRFRASTLQLSNGIMTHVKSSVHKLRIAYVSLLTKLHACACAVLQLYYPHDTPTAAVINEVLPEHQEQRHR